MSALSADAGPLLTAAAEWRMLALLLSCPRPGWREELAAQAVQPGVGEPFRRAAQAARAAGEGDYHALLGAGGVASPRAAAHAGFLDPGRILADLAARYGAFGFTPPGDEPDDHLAVECDFVAWLLLKEAWAASHGQLEAARVTREARARFLAEHVALAGQGVAARLPAGAPEHLRLAAGALAARLPAAPLPVPGRPEEDPLCEGCPAAAPPP